ncbi:MAG: HAMP domain-containing sensor histidine kinase [Candidatus Saccharimonadales bacterium]
MFNLFRSAYLKLTLFYVALLMLLSFLFSAWLYKEATRELEFGLHAPFSVQVDTGNGRTRTYLVPPRSFDQEEFIAQRVAEGKRRIFANLVLLNIIILLSGGAASYFLARRTMRPVEEAVEAQNRFTADASHELRTPLAAMKVSTEVFLRTSKGLSADQRGLLESNLEEVDRLTRLSERLLLLADTDQKQPLTEQRLDMIVKKTALLLQPLADARQIRLHTKFAELSVLGREEELRQVATILLENAIKYSADKTEINLSVRRENNHALLVVSDQGSGIAESDLPHIFDRFYRADRARTNNETSGHGLGLPIAKKIITEHHGTISVLSKPDSGSTFTVSLPTVKK